VCQTKRKLVILNCSHKTVDVVECVPQMKVLGKEFKKDGKDIKDYLQNMSQADVDSLEQSLKDKGFSIYLLSKISLGRLVRGKF